MSYPGHSLVVVGVLPLYWKTVGECYSSSQLGNWDFDIQTDYLISARRPHLVIVNNKKRKTWRIVDVAVPADHRVKLKESKNADRYLDLARELKKLWNMKVTVIPIVIGYDFQRISKVTGRRENKWTRGDYNQTKALRSAKKSPGDLRRLAVT